MSGGWTAYITNLLASSDNIKRAAIIGTDDASIWARSEGANEFKATTPELKKFVALFDNINDVPTTGCDLEGTHYIVPRTEENLIFGKKEKTGIFAAKTKMGYSSRSSRARMLPVPNVDQRSKSSPIISNRAVIS